MAKIIGKLETTDKDGIAVDLQNVGMYADEIGDTKKVIMLLEDKSEMADHDEPGDGIADPRINRELLKGYFDCDWYSF